MDPAINTQQAEAGRCGLDADPAYRSIGAHLRLWGVAIAGLVLDLWSKQWAALHLQGRESRLLIDGVLSLHFNQNPGALFGIGGKHSLAPLFLIASVVALVVVVGVFARSHRRQFSFHVGLGMIMSGALGNMYDRLFNEGRVRDFIKIELSIGKLELWPWVFNVADMLLVCGVALLMLNIWFDRKPTGTPEGDPLSGPQ